MMADAARSIMTRLGGCARRRIAWGRRSSWLIDLFQSLQQIFPVIIIGWHLIHFFCWLLYYRLTPCLVLRERERERERESIFSRETTRVGLPVNKIFIRILSWVRSCIKFLHIKTVTTTDLFSCVVFSIHRDWRLTVKSSGNYPVIDYYIWFFC